MDLDLLAILRMELHTASVGGDSLVARGSTAKLMKRVILQVLLWTFKLNCNRLPVIKTKLEYLKLPEL